MSRSARVLAVDGRRLLGETAVVAIFATLGLTTLFASVPDPDRQAGALPVGLVGIGLALGLAGSLRRRRQVAGRRLRIEVSGMVAFVLTAWAAGGVGITAGALVAGWMGWVEAGSAAEPWWAPVFGGFAALGAGVAYAAGRAAVLVWPRWDRLRRTRLLWELTHAQLAASLGLAAVVVLFLTLSALAGTVLVAWRSAAGGADSTEDAVVGFVARLVEQVVPATVVFLLGGLAIAVVLVVPVALISVVVLPRTTRRLEELAGATAALRSGDLAARVAVDGADEVARLQGDFNAMAADLERSLAQLSAERDAVACLLNDRRELVAAVSHELRTPVATVRGFLDSALANWDGAPAPTLRADLAVMAAEIDRLGRLLDDLFALSRAGVGRLPLALRPTDVGAVLRRVAAAAAPSAWERGRVEVVAEAPSPPGLPPVTVDGDRLEQIVRNLVANAVRHTPPGGFVVLSAKADCNALVVQVRDTGEGIAETDLPHVWERFYRGGDGHDGGRAGLGLALVKELTEAMGGRVAVESIPGVGSCFSLRFSLVAPL